MVLFWYHPRYCFDTTPSASWFCKILSCFISKNHFNSLMLKKTKNEAGIQIRLYRGLFNGFQKTTFKIWAGQCKWHPHPAMHPPLHFCKIFSLYVDFQTLTFFAKYSLTAKVKNVFLNFFDNLLIFNNLYKLTQTPKGCLKLSLSLVFAEVFCNFVGVVYIYGFQSFATINNQTTADNKIIY